MAHGNYRSIRGGRSQRRETMWIAFLQTSTVLSAAATANLTNALNAAALALRPFTVIRTHLEWLVISDQSAATESFTGNLAMAVVSLQASQIGVTAVPTPATDLGSDFFFLHSQWQGRFDFIGTGTANQCLCSRSIDSKAMRKVDDDSDLILVQEAGLLGSGLTSSVGGRVLIKLH